MPMNTKGIRCSSFIGQTNPRRIKDVDAAIIVIAKVDVSRVCVLATKRLNNLSSVI